MSETVPATPVRMSQAVVQIPYFLNPELQQQTLKDPSRLPPGLIGERHLVHTAALRLIATERLIERRRAWKMHVRSLPEGQEPPRRADWSGPWQEAWQFTEERRQYLLRRHPLLVRRAGRRLMRLQNEGRFAGDGMPFDRSTPLVAASDILAGHDVEPEIVVAHLHRAGYQNHKALFKLQRQGTGELLYPADARDYLHSFPPVGRRHPSDHGVRTISTQLNTSPGTLEAIAREHGIFPVVRLDDSLREQEYYTPDSRELMREIIERMPHINPETEVRISDLYDTHSRSLVDAVVTDLGLDVFLRRHTSRPARCIAKKQLSHLHRSLQYHTTLQTGEMGYDELAAALDISRSAAQSLVTAADIAQARWLRAAPGAAKRRGRTVFPPHLAAEILRRRRQYLSPDLIPETAIVARYPDLLKSQRITHLLARLQVEPVRLQLAGSSRPKKCRSWSVLRDLDERFKAPADAVPIRWEDLPYDSLDTDPEHIAYAREIQALLSSPKHVDPTPIPVWLGQVHARLRTFAATAPPEGARLLPIIARAVQTAARIGAVRAASDAPPRPRRSGRVPPPPVAFMEGTPDPAPLKTEHLPAMTPLPESAATMPVLPPVRSQAAFPAGERPYGHYGPARAHLPPEVAARYAPPQYTIRVSPHAITSRTGSNRLSAEDVSEITGAPITAVQSAISARRSMFNTPPKETRHGRTIECYEGAQLDTLLIDLVGLTPQQMARRLGLQENEVTQHLNSTPARPNAHDRYSGATWERLRADFRLPPPEQWPVTEVITGMAEKELVALAHSLGVTVTMYYIRGQGLRPHVGSGGGKLMQAQFDRYYAEDATPYPTPYSADWLNRYEVALQANCTPEEVDAWMALRVQTSLDMEWAQVRDESLRARNIRVLPHYSEGLCENFFLFMRQKRTVRQ